MNTAYGNPLGMNEASDFSRSGEKEGNYGAAWWEQGLLALWFYITFISRPGDELVLYPLAMYWLGSFMLHRDRMIPLAVRSSLIFMLPVLAMLSWGWSPAAGSALRFGMMWALTGVIAIYIAGRFAPHEIVRALFLAGLVTVLEVAPGMGDFGNRGPWGEKNIFAVRMVIIMIAAMAVSFNKYETIWFRLLALPIIPTCFVFIIIADSATSFIFASVALLTMTTIWLFWSRFAAIPHLRSFFLMMLAVVALSGIFVFFNLPNNTLYEDILASLGKDTTLTGRTMLWDAAERIVDEKPWFGVGAEGFWLWNHGAANTLLEMSHKPAGTRFSFHNSYLEVQVHLGRVGLAMLYVVVGWCLLRTVFTWLQTQSIVRSFFLLITAIVFVSSFTESWLYSVFDTKVTLFYVAAISSIMRGYSLSEMAAFRAEEEAMTMHEVPTAYGMAE